MKLYKTKRITIIPEKLLLNITLNESWRIEHSGTVKGGVTIPFKDSKPTYFFPLIRIGYEYYNGNRLLVNGIEITLVGFCLSLTIHYYRNENKLQ